MEKNVLIIDDEQNLTFFLQEGLKKEGYQVHLANSLSQGRQMIKTVFPDLLLLDLNLPDGNGLELYQELKDNQEFIPTIVITAHSSIQSAIDAMKLGVDDYIAKPFDLKELIVLIQALFDRFHVKNQLNYYRRKAQNNQDLEYFYSELPLMKELQNVALKIAGVPTSTVLIEGATGTGKEMIARFIHNNSLQAEAPFIEINCSR
jgi:two-component system response regulator AtoC